MVCRNLKGLEIVSKFKDLVEEIEKKTQYRTNIKSVKENIGSRNIRHLVQAGKKSVGNMLNEGHPSPLPKDEESRRKLVLAEDKLDGAIKLLKEVRDKSNGRRKKK